MSVGVPTGVALKCPRCRVLRPFVNVDGGTLFRCGACEWYWTLSTQAPTGTVSHFGGSRSGTRP